MNGRAQTTQDFAIGASVFLLTMAFVFALIPTVFAPFQTPVTTADTVASQRIADSVKEEITGGGATLNGSAAGTYFSSTTGENLTETYGLAGSTNVNVSLVHNGSVVDGTTVGADAVAGTGLAAGDVYRDQPVVIARRLVVDTDGTAYEIEVRVW